MSYVLIVIASWLAISLLTAFFGEPLIPKAQGKDQKRERYAYFFFKALHYILWPGVYIVFFIAFWGLCHLVGGLYSATCIMLSNSQECLSDNSIFKIISLQEGFYYFGVTTFFGLLLWLMFLGLEKTETQRERARSRLLILKRRKTLKKLGMREDFLDDMP